MNLASMSRAALAGAVILSLAACGGGGGDSGDSGSPNPNPNPGPTNFTIGGSVSGLSTSGLVLANGSDTVNVASGGTSFNFANQVVGGGSYSVTIKTQPPGQTCSLSNGSGTVGSANVTNIAVSCRNYVAYIANNNIASLGEFSISPTTSALSHVASGAVAAGVKPRDVAVSADGKFAYVVNSDPSSNSVSEYSIAADGSLTAIGSIDTDSRPVSIALTSDGKYAYVTNLDSNVVRLYTIGTDGKLSSNAAMARAVTGAAPSSITISPSGQFAYVTNFGGSTISQFKINADGTLTGLTTVQSNGVFVGPRAMAFTPDGHFAYVTNASQNSSTISEFSVGADGLLTLLRTSLPQAGAFPNAIKVSPNGKAVYVANFNDTSGALSLFSIGSDGKLSPLAGQPTVTSAAGPQAMAFTPDGSRLFVTNSGAVSSSGNGVVTEFTVNADGTLTNKQALEVDSVAVPWGITIR